MRDNFTAQTYQVGVGRQTLGNSDFTVFNATSGETPFAIKSSGEIGFGTSTIPTGAKMFVYGGTNGANIDVRGTSVADQSVIELEGNDYDTFVNSVKLQYYGLNGLGTTAGFNNQRLGVLAFGGASTSLIGTQDTTPLIFFTDNTERLRIGATGNLMIGTTTDTERLSVAGNINFSGALMPNGLSGATGTVLVSQGAGLAPVWTATSSLGITAGLTSLNGQSSTTQLFATSTSGTDFSITSSFGTHTFNLPSASAVNRGALTSADWTTFNSKLTTATGTLGQIVRTGDAQNPVFSLATTGVTTSTYGSSTTIPVITVDAQGRITSASATATPFLTAANIGSTTLGALNVTNLTATNSTTPSGTA
jgi:hypothetical protein